MSKTFRYTKFTGHYFCKYSDEWEQDGVEFDYEVENKDLLPEIANLLYEEYFADDEDFRGNFEIEKSIKEKLAEIIENHDLVDDFADDYEDTLKDIFQNEALEFYGS